jgi:protein tyrosine/serine phosphatase
MYPTGFSTKLKILSLLLITTELLISTNFLFATKSATEKEIHINSFKKFLDRFHAVQPGLLYRSAQLKPSRLRKYVQKFGIKTVINLRGVNRKTKWWEDEHATVKELNVNYFNIPFSARVISNKKNIQKLLYLYKFAPKPILIHCLDGIDRSGEAAALWVLEQQGRSKKDAFKQLSLKYGYLKFRRPQKHLLISIWQGKKWLNQAYNPKNYA